MSVRRPDPLLLIGGCPRSGTTLLRNMLDAHPELAVPVESQVVIDVLAEGAVAGSLSDLPAIWRRIRAHPNFAAWGLADEEVAAELRGRPADSYAELIRALLAAYARAQEKSHSAHKAPGHARLFHRLGELFPRSRMAMVVRDPREVAMSLSVQAFSTGGLVRAAIVWRNHARAARLARQVRGGERPLEVRYERLVGDPADELKRVCDQVGLEYDERMLDHTRGHVDGGAHHGTSGQPIRADLRRWREEMRPSEVALVEAIAGEEMELAGYRRVAGRLALSRAAPAVWRERVGSYLRGRVRDRHRLAMPVSYAEAVGSGRKLSAADQPTVPLREANIHEVASTQTV